MDRITSRQNAVIRFFRDLSKDADLRQREKLFLCDGGKLMNEALRSSAEIKTVLWKKERIPGFPAFTEEYILPADLFDYVAVPIYKEDYLGVFDQPYTITVQAEGIPAANYPDGLPVEDTEDGAGNVTAKGAISIFSENAA